MKPIYTADLETDPFQYKRRPKPFAGGVYTGTEYFDVWHTQGGDKVVDDLMAIWRRLKPGLIYIHNGGKFDLFFMFKHIATEKPIMIINGRIVRCYVKCETGYHEVRDSYAIMPFALEKYQKTKIDYKLFERGVRGKHKEKIRAYQKDDCVYLHELVSDFVDRFGPNLTIGGTAMKELKKLHDFEVLDFETDQSIRKRFYYGGRVQCFEKGILKPKGDAFRVYDINQSYPNAMKNFLHPISAPYYSPRDITDESYFLTVVGISHGCFPVREKMGVNFPTGFGRFHVTIHEYLAAMELGLFELADIEEIIDFPVAATFAEFVDKFHGLRKKAQMEKDERGSLFYKGVGTSAYGKFAQSPENYFDYKLTASNIDIRDTGFERCELIEFADMLLWRKPSDDDRRYNVATGASITGAARAVLMRGLHSSTRPIYCDTDSVICESFGEEIDDTKIGAWKFEKDGDKLAIAGKKMYALFKGNEVVKLASKGVRISGQDMLRAAKGETVTYYKDAPTYNMQHGTVKFMSRRVTLT